MLRKIVPQDLVKYGLIPELIGRLPVITVLDPLDEEALMSILSEPKNSLEKQYKALFGYDGIELDITDEAKREIAKKALSQKTGARGLRSIVEEALQKPMFETPSQSDVIKITVTPETIRDGADVTVERGEKIDRDRKKQIRKQA